MILISQAQSKRAFGAWDDTPVEDTSYLAATDGLVCCTASTENALIQGYTDGDDPPTTERVRDLGGSGSGNDAGLTMPVRKGDYWKITCAPGNLDDLFWLPAES